MSGHPLWNFIAFDQLFNKNNSTSGGSGGGDDNNSKWALIITIAIFAIFFIYCIVKELAS